MDRVPYDEFGYFAENAEEFGIPYDAPPVVRREMVSLSDGRELSALVWGVGEPVVVLVHGGAQNAHTWDTVMLSLGMPGVAIDLPGHGHSGPPAGAVTDVRRNAEDVMEVIDELAPLAPMLVGMSLGGLTSFALIDKYPEQFDTVLIVDITPSVKRENAEHIPHSSMAPRASRASTTSWIEPNNSTRRAPLRRSGEAFSTTPSNSRMERGYGVTPSTESSAKPVSPPRSLGRTISCGAVLRSTEGVWCWRGGCATPRSSPTKRSPTCGDADPMSSSRTSLLLATASKATCPSSSPRSSPSNSTGSWRSNSIECWLSVLAQPWRASPN